MTALLHADKMLHTGTYGFILQPLLHTERNSIRKLLLMSIVVDLTLYHYDQVSFAKKNRGLELSLVGLHKLPLQNRFV